MKGDLYRLIYCSRSDLDLAGPSGRAAVAQILEASRRNNPPMRLTGVLMFNSTGFAQVLEGPRPHIEEVFERIQNDPRHHDVRVIDYGEARERTFAGWSMGFIGRRRLGEAFDAILDALDETAATHIDGDEVCRRLRDSLVEEESDRHAAEGAAAPRPVA